jgi:hypothetical protein
MKETRREGQQNPLVHEGDSPDPLDSNEKADEKVEVRQPSGDDAPAARD